MNASIDFYNVTILSQCMQIISPFLQDPTLIYHDGHDRIDVISSIISQTHSTLIAKIPEQPNNEKLYSMRSAILLQGEGQPFGSPISMKFGLALPLLAESPEPMMSILRIWPLWKARSRVVVFVQNSTEVHEWIESLWKKTRAADILVVVPSETPQYFTWYPYKPEECSNVSTIVSVNAPNLFPKKFTPPLNGCPLIAVTTILSPFVVDEMHGSETRLFRDLAEKLGMKPSFLALAPGLNVWTVFDSKYQPFNGLKLVYENDADIMFSQMSMSEVTAPFAEFLMPHISEVNIFFVPGPVVAPATTAILKAFAPRAWIFVIMGSFLIYAAMAIIPFLENGRLQPAFVPAVAIILNLPSNFLPSKAILTFVAVAYLYSIHITTAYTSSLIVFLSDVPRERPMQSFQDVVDSGLDVQVHIAFYSTITTLSSGPLMNALNQPGRMKFVTSLNLTQVAERKTVVIGPKISFSAKLHEDVYFDEFDYPRIKTLRESIFITFLTFYISKGHPLFEELNANFIRLLEGGFPQHYSYLVEIPERPLIRKLEPFAIKNVEGPFILLLSLLAACTFVWVSEWIFYWLRFLLKRKSPVARFQSPRRVPRVIGVLTRKVTRQGKII